MFSSNLITVQLLYNHVASQHLIKILYYFLKTVLRALKGFNLKLRPFYSTDREIYEFKYITSNNFCLPYIALHFHWGYQAWQQLEKHKFCLLVASRQQVILVDLNGKTCDCVVILMETLPAIQNRLIGLNSQQIKAFTELVHRMRK